MEEQKNLNPAEEYDRQDNIYKRMMKATAFIGRVAKNLNVGFGQNTYKAVCETDVLAAVKPAEAKFGIYSYPHEREILEYGKISRVNRDGSAKEDVYIRIQTTYRFVNTDNPDEHIDVTSYSIGIDSADKAEGKAMTYGDKYALMKGYKIETGEDPDAKASPDVEKQDVKAAQKRAPRNNAPETPKNTPSTEETMRQRRIDSLNAFCAENGVNPGFVTYLWKTDAFEKMTDKQLAYALSDDGKKYVMERWTAEITKDETNEKGDNKNE